MRHADCDPADARPEASKVRRADRVLPDDGCEGSAKPSAHCPTARVIPYSLCWRGMSSAESTSCVTIPCLQFSEQPGVLDGDDGLVGEGLE